MSQPKIAKPDDRGRMTEDGTTSFVIWSLSSVLDQIAEQAGGDRKLRQREPGTRDVVHGGADALDLAGARLDPGLDGGGSRHAIDDHLDGQPPFRLGDRVERAIERQAVEIVGDLDVAGRTDDAI